MTEIVEKKKFWSGSLWIAGYYAISFLIVFIGEKIGPSGGHSPGLGGIYAIALFPLITLTILIANLISDFGHRKLSGRIFIHVVGIVLFGIWLAKY